MDYINIYYTEYLEGKIIGLDLCSLEFIVEAEKARYDDTYNLIQNITRN